MTRCSLVRGRSAIPMEISSILAITWQLLYLPHSLFQEKKKERRYFIGIDLDFMKSSFSYFCELFSLLPPTKKFTRNLILILRLAMIFEKNQVARLCFICLIKCIFVLSCEHNDNCAVDEVNDKSIRKERALLFPPSSTIGVSTLFYNATITSLPNKQKQLIGIV